MDGKEQLNMVKVVTTYYNIFNFVKQLIQSILIEGDEGYNKKGRLLRRYLQRSNFANLETQ